MAEFLISFKRTVGIEKGKQTDARDKGNLPGKGTIYGISSRWFPKWYDKINYLYEKGDFDAALKLAEQCYKINFWEVIRGDKIESQMVADQLFDMAVNHDPRTAIEITQRSLSSLGFTLSFDGIMGLRTISSVNSANEKELNNEMVIERLAYIYKLEEDPKNQWAVNGWKNRAKSFIVS